MLNELFAFLDTAKPDEVPTGFDGFKYVNGGIFEEKIKLPPLGKDFRIAILDACAVDWSSISPAIFGSMFQSVRDAETRRALGLALSACLNAPVPQTTYGVFRM